MPDSGYLDGKLIHFVRQDGRIVWDGDILLDDADVTAKPSAAKAASTGRYSWVNRWPNGKIFYTLDPATPHQDLLRQAMEYWQARSNIRFIERTSARNSEFDREYFRIGPASSGCASSYVGRKAGSSQDVWFGPNCVSDHMQHELGHVIGMHHEHNRADRDAYVNIYPERMDAGSCQTQYTRYVDAGLEDGVDVGPFDFGSIMIYPSLKCTKNFSYPAMTRKDGSTFYGGLTLSGGDLAGARYAYSRKHSSRRRDFTGDGLSDLIYFNWKYANGSITRANNSGSFTFHGEWVGPGSFYDLKSGEYRVGDFNGDGLADLLFISPPGGMYVRLNTGSGFGPSTEWLFQGRLGSLEKHDIYYIGDFNGDGLDDVGSAYSALEGSWSNTFRIAVNQGGSFDLGRTWLFPNSMGTSQTGEYLVGYFNADNIADLMWIGNAGDVHVRMSNGTNLSTLQDWVPAGQFGDLNRGGEYLVGDMTCDGMDDLLFIDPTDNSGWVAASQGNGLSPKANWIPAGTFGNRGKGEYILGMHTPPWLTNNKKCADLLFIQEDGRVLSMRSNGTGFYGGGTVINPGAFGRPQDGGQYF